MGFLGPYTVAEEEKMISLQPCLAITFKSTKVPETTKAPETEVPKSSGCGSTVGGGIAIVALVGIAVIAVCKKED